MTLAGLNWVRKLAGAAPLNTYMITETSATSGLTGNSLTNWFKSGATTEYHVAGTVSMMPREHGGVVDTNLVVYGTKNLRVVSCFSPSSPPGASFIQLILLCY